MSQKVVILPTVCRLVFAEQLRIGVLLIGVLTTEVWFHCWHCLCWLGFGVWLWFSSRCLWKSGAFVEGVDFLHVHFAKAFALAQFAGAFVSFLLDSFPSAVLQL